MAEKNQSTLKQRLASPEPLMSRVAGAASVAPASPSPSVGAIPSPEDVKKRTEDRKKVEQVATEPAVQTPNLAQQSLRKVESLAADLPPAQKREFEQRADKIREAQAAAIEEFARTKDRNRWLQVAESLGQAMTQLGAGAYGLKHNVDLSGLRFNRADWAENLKAAERDLDRKLGLADRDLTSLEKERKEALLAEERGLIRKEGREKEAADRALTEKAMEAKAAARLAKTELTPEEQREKELKRQELELKIKKAQQETKFTDTQKQRLKDIAATITAWDVGKAGEPSGRAKYQQNVSAINEALDKLQDPNVELGGILDVLDEDNRLLLSNIVPGLENVAEGARAQQLLKGVYQENLRKVLGAQFTETEGKMLLDRTFGAQMGKEQLIKNAKRLQKMLDDVAVQREALTDLAARPDGEEKLLNHRFKGRLVQELDKLKDDAERKLSQADKEALKWIEKNPKDPRAAEMKKIIDKKLSK